MRHQTNTQDPLGVFGQAWLPHVGRQAGALVGLLLEGGDLPAQAFDLGVDEGDPLPLP
jgi:hypothetical protein